MSEVDVKIPCQLVWRILLDFSNGNIPVEQSTAVPFTKTKKVTGKDFLKVLNEKAREEASRLRLPTASATWAPVRAWIPVGYGASSMLKEFVSSAIEVTSETHESWEEKHSQVVSIGAGDHLFFYQRYFYAPGMTFALDGVCGVRQMKTAADNQNIDVVVRARAVQYVRDLRVVVASEIDPPDDHVREVHGLSADINYLFGGDYVALVPNYTYDPNEAATGFEVRIQDNTMSNMPELLSGPEDDHRYAVALHDRRQAKKVVEVKLYRSKHRIVEDYEIKMDSILGPTWEGPSRDINERRGGDDYLYLIWRLS